MTSHSEWFVSYTKKFTKDEVYLGDNSSHDIEGRGTVMITLHSGEARTIENVLHIPTFKNNLISICRVTDAGYWVEFTTDSCFIKDQEGKHLLPHEEG
jgi:hypothetical protein